MGFIELRDETLAGRVSRLAQRLGTTEEDAIGQALRAYEARLNMDEPMPDKRRDFTAWVKEYRRRNPLPRATGLVADKAFYDSLNDDDVD